MLYNLKHHAAGHFSRIIFHLSRGGSDLIDVTISTFLIMGLLAALFAAAGTYRHIRKAQLETIATKIASRDIEYLRKFEYNLIVLGTVTLSDPDIAAKLPSPRSATRTIAQYCNPTCTADAKKITELVTWTEKGITRNITIVTVISKYGLLNKNP